MKQFNVYPKRGESFAIGCKRFSFESDHFVVYDSADEPSDNGFLSFENIAAICIADQWRPRLDDVRSFQIYLKGRTEPIVIFAHYFKTDALQGVGFFWINIRGEDVKIENIYIALSEVVAILPAGGLNKYL